MNVRMIAAAMTALFGIASLAHADEKKGPPDEKAIMEAMMKAATPGAAHKKLDYFVGSWDCVNKFWMDPSKSPQESKATADVKWIMGNRYLETKVLGDISGMKFEGLGLTGYNNLTKEYHGTWIDSMGTGAERMVGKLSEDGKTMTSTGESMCPITNKMLKGREVTKIINDDKYTSEFYKSMEIDGKEQEVKVMEITYTRKK